MTKKIWDLSWSRELIIEKIAKLETKKFKIKLVTRELFIINEITFE